MREVVVLLLVALGVVACSKDQSADKSGSATITGASVNGRPPTSDEIRLVLLQARPNDSEINAFIITDEGGLVTLRGSVPDEQTHMDMVNRVKSMPNVTSVRDQLEVSSSPQPSVMATAGKSTPTTDSVRTTMKKDQPKAMGVIDQLIITDDGTAIVIHGVVPDDATHDALIASAKKSSDGKKITDEMSVSK